VSWHDRARRDLRRNTHHTAATADPQPLKPFAGRSQRRADDRVEQFPIPDAGPEHAARPPWPRTLDLRREANTTFVDSNEQLNIERRTFDRFGAG